MQQRQLMFQDLKLETIFSRHSPRAVRWDLVPSPYQPLFIGVAEDDRICRITFSQKRSAEALLAEAVKAWPRTAFTRDRVGIKKILAQLLTRQGTVKVAMVGTDFQQAVWKEILKVPPGETCSYADVAARIRNPRAVRAVGTACGANPVPLLIPCHRIVGSNGGFGGFGGGLDLKRQLLASEGYRHAA